MATDVKIERVGSSIHVGPTKATACDVLEFARELINTFGWNSSFNLAANHNHASVTLPSGAIVPTPSTVESSDKTGYTLHDAIGAVGTRIAGDKESQGLRQEATAMLNKHIGSFTDDKAWENALGRTQADVIQLLDDTIAAECS